MEWHVRNLGRLMIVLGIVFGIASIAILLLFGGYDGLLLTDDPFNKRHDVASLPLDRILAAVLLTFSLILTAPLIVIGRGILRWKSWAKTAGTLLAGICALHFPIGTAACMYALWVLHDDATEFLFENPPVARHR